MNEGWQVSDRMAKEMLSLEREGLCPHTLLF